MEQEELNGVVAENLAKYRKAAGLTQSELAEKLNYSDKSVSKWEQGNGMPDVYVLYKLAGLYGVTVNDLLCRHEIVSPRPDKRKRFIARWMILAMSAGLCWLVAVVAFVFIRLFAPGLSYAWLPFLYALPVTFIVALVFGCVWKFYFLRAVAGTGLLWTTLLAVYVTLGAFVPSDNLFIIFLIGVPLQVLVVLWLLFRRRIHRKK